jgi:predicted Zn-dependent peptidase
LAIHWRSIGDPLAIHWRSIGDPLAIHWRSGRRRAANRAKQATVGSLPLGCLWVWLALGPTDPAGPIDDAPDPPPEPPNVLTEARAQTVTFADDPLGVRQVTLDNGLTVYLSENHEQPEIFGAVVVRTGGKNDPPDNTGMAHYLEHMLFKGTQRLGTTNWKAEAPLQSRLESLYEQLGTAPDDAARKKIGAQISATVAKTYAYAVPNEIDQLLESIGGSGVNAFTTYDETVYHNTFPASQVDTWLQIYAERFVDPVFRLFPTELEAVYEEKNIAIDTTGYELFRGFMRGAFGDHPYGTNDILGEVEHLKRPSLKVMAEYFDTWYVPSNMALVLSGDFDSDAVLPLVEARFGRWKAGPTPTQVDRPVRAFGVDERLRLRATPVRAGAIAFRTVPESHPDFAALQVARRLLSNAQRSGFVDQLSDDGKVLFAVHVPADLADHNLDVVAYVPRIVTQTFRGAERLVLAQFARVREGDFDDAQFEAVKEGLLVEAQTTFEDNSDRALTIAHAFVAEGGWRGHLDYLHRLQRLTRQDVERVAGQLFGPRRLVLRSRMGFPRKTRLEKPRVPAVEPRRGAHSDLFAQIQRAPKPAPRIRYVDVPNATTTAQVEDAVRVRANDNPFNDLVQLDLRFSVGEDAIAALDVLDDYLLRIGAGSADAEAYRAKWFAISTTLRAFAELDEFVVRIEGPRDHLREALGLVDDLMHAPKPERRALRQLRREIWAFRRYERKDPPNVGRALRDWALYGDEAPERRHFGPGRARRLSKRRLLEAWERVQTYPLSIDYVGNDAPQTVAAMVDETLTLPTATKAAVAHVVYPRQDVAETTVYFVPRRDAVQTQLWFSVEGGPLRPDERAAADAFEAYFGGSMAGLVFQEIREYRALAYSAKGAYWRDDEPTQRGHLVGYVGCQADKTFEALDVMVGLVTDMPKKPGRLGLVRDALARGAETDSPGFRELQATIDDWRELGYDDDPRRTLVPAYDDLEFSQIEEFYRAHVAGRPLTIMVVGDPRKVKPAKLRAYGRLVRVREGKLYSR